MVSEGGTADAARVYMGPLAIKSRGKGKEVREREGYGSLREPILYSALRARAVARMGAENGCTQAVALLWRPGPVVPALRRREPLHEGECVFPAPRGERSERSVLLWMSEIRSKESHRYRLLPFKSLSSKPSQELGGCLNEVKAGGFSTVLSTRL